ncbi:TetR/AcrR family transcriptional regulator [Anaerocolumna jejuensis]|uniref:TetR/AcrR family transcriptional regulator n=1 Tax=Anaerocolumna jejuensis TaxID=259063 RepID=UPI003F7C5F8B
MRNLKNDFAEAVKKMLDSKTLDKITVTDIVNDCKVSRQAFYYHFSDIYDIIEWIFKQETEYALEQHRNIETWQIGYCNLLNWLKDNRSLVSNTYKSIQREYIENFMYHVLFTYINQVVEEQAKGLNVSSDQKEFVTKYFTLSFNGIALDWIRNGMKEEPEKIVKNIEVLVRGDFKKALEKMHAENLREIKG